MTSRYAILAWSGALWLIVWFVVPILWMIWDLAASQEFQDTLSFSGSERTVNLRAFRNTFETAAIVTILCLIAGYIVAYFLVSVGPRVRIILMSLVLIPYWVSIIIRTYGLIVTLGRKGFVNETLIDAGLIEEPLRIMFTTNAVYLGMVQVLLPYVVLTVYTSLEAIDDNLFTAARSLGAGGWNVFRKVTLPLSLPGVYAGGIIVFIISLGAYVTPALIGGPGDIMIAQIVWINATEFGQFGTAIVLVLPLIVVTLALFVVFNRFVGVDRMLGTGGTAEQR
ncbi:MAG: ABC transporter permease [Acidimicrobiaceae bacterium]|nr:ABC transporter permease [Acidimicrobiaceae bacterium]MDE0666738.1 ABC transporter permease [Acidimicrobiaceae bacterium]MXY10238.1 ABC transporter permease [Acidimicrobiaceae bacterium]MXZ64122.1 ABC transporter permease [Acidimicrobiaceae bacterium]MYA13569.1 ABC transporter permease [Acidimicrobiaceae bacterium]